MTPDPTDVEIRRNDPAAYEQLSGERQRTLFAPEDDMWATFADQAEPCSLTWAGRLVGRFSVDEDRRLHAFHVRDEFEAMSADLLGRAVTELDAVAVVTSTVDPVLLSLALAAGGEVRPAALMYDHVAGSEVDGHVDLRPATGADLPDAVALSRAATGGPEAFLVPYLAQRVDLGELYLVETAGRVVALGECRVDRRAPGNAHLGLVVDPEVRGQGLGSRLMHSLTDLARRRNLTPRCSTEPTNLAAQKAIRRSGFRNRHRVFRIAVTASERHGP